MLNQIVKNQPKFNIIKIISIFALICLTVEIYVIGQRRSGENLGEIIGKTMVYSIFVVLIFPRRWLKTSSMAIIIPITLCFTVTTAHELYRMGVVERDARQCMLAVKTSFNEDKTLSNDQIAKMDLGIFSDFFKIMNDKKIKIENIYLQYTQFCTLKIDKALDANTLADKRQRNIYRENLFEIKKEITKCTEQIENLLGYVESDFQMDKIPFEERSYVIAGIKKGIKKQQDYHREMFELELNSVNAVLNIYAFLDKHNGDFSLINNQLLFNNKVDSENFNVLLNTFEQISTRQDMLSKEFRDEIKSKIEQFD